MNETALPIITALAMNAQAQATLLGTFSAAEHYSDGLNLYSFAASTPVTRVDPLGLSWGLEDEIDEAIAGLALDYLGGAQTVAAASMMIKRGVGATTAYATLAFAWDGLVWDLGEAALFDVIASPFGSTICFAAGTQILLADGSTVPIEDIRPDDIVACDRDGNLSTGPEAARVHRVFARETSKLQQVTFSDWTRDFVVLTTPEHPFFVEDVRGFLPARDLVAGQLLHGYGGTVVVISNVAIDRSITVYNFEVDDAHNYFICDADGSHCLLVHNSCKDWYQRFGKLFRGLGKTIHHVIPQAVWREFGEFLSRLNLHNMHDFFNLMTLPGGSQIGSHPEYSRMVREALRRFERAVAAGRMTIAEAEQAVIELIGELKRSIRGGNRPIR